MKKNILTLEIFFLLILSIVSFNVSAREIDNSTSGKIKTDKAGAVKPNKDAVGKESNEGHVNLFKSSVHDSYYDFVNNNQFYFGIVLGGFIDSGRDSTLDEMVFGKAGSSAVVYGATIGWRSSKIGDFFYIGARGKFMGGGDFKSRTTYLSDSFSMHVQPKFTALALVDLYFTPFFKISGGVSYQSAKIDMYRNGLMFKPERASVKYNSDVGGYFGFGSELGIGPAMFGADIGFLVKSEVMFSDPISDKIYGSDYSSRVSKRFSSDNLVPYVGVWVAIRI